jgi:hypothetical protein
VFQRNGGVGNDEYQNDGGQHIGGSLKLEPLLRDCTNSYIEWKKSGKVTSSRLCIATLPGEIPTN